MKKNNILLIICSLIALSGCNFNISSSNSNSTSTLNPSMNSSSIIEIITGVEIAGPKSCMVGKTIKLIADVLGSNNDDVIWSSNNLNIATIDEDGILTGISEGEVEIKAASKKDETKFSTTTISITLPKATEIRIEVEANENISYDKNTNTYSIPLGQTFYVNSIFENVKIPDVSYSLTYPSGTSEETTVKLEMIENSTRAKVIGYAAMEGLIITATGKYNDLATGNLINSVKINIVDINNDNYKNTLNIINSLKDKEISSLLSSNIKRTKEITTNNETYKEIHELEHISFTNSTYVNKTISKYENDNLSEKNDYHYYQGINNVNMKDYYYTFEYDENDSIKNIYSPSNNKDNITCMFDVDSNITYGHYGLLNNILGNKSSIFDGSISTLSNIYIYAYANFEITSNSIKITSNCYDEDYDVNYSFDFELNHNNNSITNYSIKEEIKNTTTTITYSEICDDLVYGTKVIDNETNNENYLNINKYYITDFEISEFNKKDPNGNYDYSDKNKYGADYVIPNSENGLTKYVSTYDKAIILKINVNEPSTANVNLDLVSSESSDTDQIPSVTSFKDGIFAINAKKDDNGNSLPGKAIFTFKTTLGYEEKIIIEFTKTILKSLKVNYGNDGPKYDSNKKTYVFNSIFEKEYSTYFFINPTPDEEGYEYAIDVIEGNENGISLHKFEKGNIYGHPNYSYGIYGNLSGTYKFKVYVKDYNVYDTKTFEITVNEPISNDAIESKIIGNSYEYKGFSTITSKFTFTTSTLITYEETSIDGTIESTFNYHIENGSIIIDNIQNFTKGSYFSRMNKGSIIFSEDFKSIKFHLEIYSENQLEGTSFFQYYEYEFVVIPIEAEEIYDFINNKTFILNTTKVSFKDGKGTLEYYQFDGTFIASFTFDYEYNSTLKNIVISNANSSSNEYTLVESDYVFNYYIQVLEFKITQSDGNWDLLKFSLQ